MSAPTLQDVMAELSSLRDEMRGLRADLDALKTDVATLQARAGGDEVDQETLAMLAAVVTSYLGKRVRIRSARHVPADVERAAAWARHGRAAIQTSHQLPRGH